MEFVYINAKNINTNYIFFKLNYSYYPYMFFKDTNPCLRFYLANKLAKELKNLILIYQQNLIYTQKQQK